MKSKTAVQVLFIFLCSFIAVLAQVWSGDPDVFWHLKVGEWIVAHGAVPATDIYSWTVYGEPWTAHQWAWESLMYVVHRHLGLAGLWLLALLMGVLAGLLIRAGLKSRGVEAQVATLAGGFGSLLLLGWLKPWPQAGVYALFAVYLFLSLRNRWGWGETLLTAGVGMLWANIHSTAVMFPLLLLVEAGWGAVVAGERAGWRWAAAAAAGAATLINPHGYGLWVYAVGEGLLSQAYRARIFEWMPYNFAAYGLAVVFFICVVMLLAAVRQGREKELEFLRAAGFWVLALMSRIYTPYAVLSAVALLGLLELRLQRGSFARISAVALLLAVALTVNTGLTRGFPHDLEAVAASDQYPVEATDFIIQQGYDRVYNPHGWGGYLIWRGVPVYIDGRNDVYQGTFEQYLNLIENERPVGQVLKETGAEAVLATSGESVDAILKESSRWREVYRDQVAAVYVSTVTGEGPLSRSLE